MERLTLPHPSQNSLPHFPTSLNTSTRLGPGRRFWMGWWLVGRWGYAKRQEFGGWGLGMAEWPNAERPKWDGWYDVGCRTARGQGAITKSKKKQYGRAGVLRCSGLTGHWAHATRGPWPVALDPSPFTPPRKAPNTRGPRPLGQRPRPRGPKARKIALDSGLWTLNPGPLDLQTRLTARRVAGQGGEEQRTGSTLDAPTSRRGLRPPAPSGKS